MGILVVCDPTDPFTQQQKRAVPSLLGMNIIWSFYKELFADILTTSAQASPMDKDSRVWWQAFTTCQSIENLHSKGCLGKARVQSSEYKIRPLEGTGPEKNIHRSELRVIPTKAQADLNPSTILQRMGPSRPREVGIK